MKNTVKLYYSRMNKTDNFILAGITVIGLCFLAWGAEWVLCRLLAKYRGAETLLELGLWLFVFAMVGGYGYMIVCRDRMELILGTDQWGKLYWLPCRKAIMRDPQFSEEPDLERLVYKEKRLPGLPQGSREIVGTVKIKKKEGYYLFQCLVRSGKDRTVKKQSFALSNLYVNDFEELMQAFQAVQ